jgi:hypothetical protein
VFVSCYSRTELLNTIYKNLTFQNLSASGNSSTWSHVTLTYVKHICTPEASTSATQNVYETCMYFISDSLRMSSAGT